MDLRLRITRTAMLVVVLACLAMPAPAFASTVLSFEGESAGALIGAQYDSLGVDFVQTAPENAALPQIVAGSRVRPASGTRRWP